MIDATIPGRASVRPSVDSSTTSEGWTTLRVLVWRGTIIIFAIQSPKTWLGRLLL